MHIKSAVVFVSVVATVWVGYFAQGQVREKAADAVKKGAAPGTKAPPAAPKAEAGKKSADAAKSPVVAAKPNTGKPAEDPDEKAIRASAEAFTKLYNAHDVKGLAALFAPKAEMIDENDNIVKGREAIEKEFAKVFKDDPTASMEVDVDSVRVLTPMLAIEEGTARSKDSPDAPVDVTVYVAIHVKVDGKWQLACVRDWDAPASELSPHDLLERDLAWLVGEWIEETPDSVVQTKCEWHDNGNFLIQEFQVHVGGEIAMSGTQRIGWDAVAKQFRSWVFDSHGGHAGGLWLRDGDEWIVKSQGATAAGETGSATNIYRCIDGDTIGWRSTDRVVDGERREDIDEIIMKRRPPRPGS
jgi:uncharacterized protein (TIGR02246 family)